MVRLCPLDHLVDEWKGLSGAHEYLLAHSVLDNADMDILDDLEKGMAEVALRLANWCVFAVGYADICAEQPLAIAPTCSQSVP